MIPISVSAARVGRRMGQSCDIYYPSRRASESGALHFVMHRTWGITFTRSVGFRPPAFTQTYIGLALDPRMSGRAGRVSLSLTSMET